MIEMAASASPGLYQRGIAGDSYNTAVYLARAGLAVDYLTRLGDDTFSDDILEHLAQEGIGTGLVTRVAGRQPGLYLITNAANGERTFSYWRDRAPARDLFLKPLEVTGMDAFYFTGITLAVSRSGSANLLRLLQQLRESGCRIVFDPNFRAALWDDLAQAQAHYRAVLPHCDMVLPTLDDESLLWGEDSAQACRDRYLDGGASEVVIKGPALTAHAHTGSEHCSAQAAAVAAVDTTGAGDAFNAGYLAARLGGSSLEQALQQAQQLAAAVVQHRGAILPNKKQGA